VATTRLVILVATYLLIAIQRLPWGKVSRPLAALAGAVAMVTLGGLNLRDAYTAIDLDVMVFLLGVLVLTAHLEEGGFFEWAAARIVRRATSPRALLAAVVVASGLLSAFFVNDTICLVLTPLLLAVLRPLDLEPLPYLLALALAANVGSAMTPVGNPQNMLIAVRSGLPFGRFVMSLALPSIGGLMLVFGVVAVVHRRALGRALPAGPAAAPAERAFDRPMVVRAIVVFGGALVAWLLGFSMPLVAITAATVLMLIAGRDSGKTLASVEWPLLLFFGALFVVMRGARDLPVVASLSLAAARHLGGTPMHDAVVVSGAMTALSNLVSNVPAVILWLPVVPGLAHAAFIWLAMAMSSTFAGNLTLLGSMANLIVAERAEARGTRVGFVEYLRVGVPTTLLTLAWGVAMLVLLSGGSFGR
jgi:Na+/H+ antiporter NhaD/arsenite permease-like protein